MGENLIKISQYALKALSMTSVFIAIAFNITNVAHADESISGANINQSTTTLPGSVKNKTPGADEVDDILTNPNLRAYSGSKSRWSLSTMFNYDGGTLSKPLAEDRPNISGMSATSTDTDFNGQLSIKYNVTAVHSILLGFGIRKMAPFVASGPRAKFYQEGGKDMDMFDPTLTYQYIYKLGQVQSVFQAIITEYTRQDIVSPVGSGNNNAQNFQVDQENMYEIGTSGLSIGASIGAGTNTPTDPSQDYSKFQWWLLPYLEYKINDLMNFRTVSNLWYYEFYQQAGLVRDKVTQSVGVGFSISRDFFLYPNIQFLPDQIALNLTNVGVTATINMF